MPRLPVSLTFPQDTPSPLDTVRPPLRDTPPSLSQLLMETRPIIRNPTAPRLRRPLTTSMAARRPTSPVRPSLPTTRIGHRSHPTLHPQLPPRCPCLTSASRLVLRHRQRRLSDLHALPPSPLPPAKLLRCTLHPHNQRAIRRTQPRLPTLLRSRQPTRALCPTLSIRAERPVQRTLLVACRLGGTHTRSR